MSKLCHHSGSNRGRKLNFYRFFSWFFHVSHCTMTKFKSSSHSLAHSTPKISAKLAHRCPSNRPPRQASWVKNDENCRFLTVFQPLLPHTSTHPDKIQNIRSHTLARWPPKISAKFVHKHLSYWPCRRANWAKKGKKYRFFDSFSTAAPAYLDVSWRNLNHP